ncbi:18K peptidoglycan-associated outer membrane lipoprotein [Marinobacterium lacunae]|uniref:Peptidoglycan-associated lipoprotein n=1 Tax=Marinobacterium lacunae TaxID=1232683 RepID=A0A081FU49_9GAMM|nr:peptidoglycan-associated lipoprotein Pal [Marinobacterium lacunae]KEA62054.1 18K peptidoglycan-associated outer membrane lipoprotein [Marinobacterium lacunae]MBR9883032.1 peptidoglycan-associated lipoprotein Pal [Oceanospirillales bacterium]
MRALNVMKAAALGAAVIWAAGCSTTSTTTDAGDAGMSGQDGSANAYGSNGAGVSGSDMTDVNQLQTVFYFDFDQSVVKQDGFADLEAHARYLASHPSASVRLEGHADERGTREYNIALGERRAQSVERLLVVNGASASQIETISYGEEKPAVMGQGEASWAQNRRVELKYVSR